MKLKGKTMDTLNSTVAQNSLEAQGQSLAKQKPPSLSYTVARVGVLSFLDIQTIHKPLTTYPCFHCEKHPVSRQFTICERCQRRSNRRAQREQYGPMTTALADRLYLAFQRESQPVAESWRAIWRGLWKATSDPTIPTYHRYDFLAARKTCVEIYAAIRWPGVIA
jgi:hypothetical protein